MKHWWLDLQEKGKRTRPEPSFIVELRRDVSPEENADFRKVLDKARAGRWSGWAIRLVAWTYGYRLRKP